MTSPSWTGGDRAPDVADDLVPLSVLDELPDGCVVLGSDWVHRDVTPVARLYPEAEGTVFQQAFPRVMQTRPATITPRPQSSSPP